MIGCLVCELFVAFSDEILKSKQQLTKDLSNAKVEIAALKEEKSVAGEPSEQKEIDDLVRENAELRLALDETRGRERQEGKVREAAEEFGQVSWEKVQCLTERAEKAEEEAGRLSDLATQLEERCQSTIPPLEAEVAALKKREQALQYEVETLQKRLALKENEYDRQNLTVNELRDKIISQEEEILKFEAVIEEKNLEHTNTFRKLKQHEEFTRTTLTQLGEERLQLEQRIRELEQRQGGDKNADGSNSRERHQFDALIKDLLSKFSAQVRNCFFLFLKKFVFNFLFDGLFIEA